MTPQEKHALRKLRDEIDGEEDRRLVRKAVNYIERLERKLSSVRVLLNSAMKETDAREGEG